MGNNAPSKKEGEMVSWRPGGALIRVKGDSPGRAERRRASAIMPGLPARCNAISSYGSKRISVIILSLEISFQQWFV